MTLLTILDPKTNKKCMVCAVTMAEVIEKAIEGLDLPNQPHKVCLLTTRII